jgi:hypothetical protein
MCVTPACASEEPDEHSLFYQTYPDSLERSIKRPESIHHRTDRAAPGAVIARKARTPEKKRGYGKVILPIEIPHVSSWSSFETAGATSGMESASMVTAETGLLPPGCALAFQFLSPASPKKDDCSQASPTSVTDIVGDLMELQDQLKALRATSPQLTGGGCTWSPSSPTSTLTRPTSARAFLAVNKVANFSRKRMDQLDTFLMAKSSGRDSPEALRLAYSGTHDSAGALLRKACLDKPEPPPVEEEEEEKEDCLDASRDYSFASLHTFEASQDRDSPDTVPPPPPPPHKPPPRKSVRFAKELVTHIMRRPATLPEENVQLYFGKEELQELERDRMEQIYGEQFEIVHQEGKQVQVTFPGRPFEFPPELTDISSSWDSQDCLMEI